MTKNLQMEERSVRIINTPSDEVRKSFFYVQETGYIKLGDSKATQKTSIHF